MVNEMWNIPMFDMNFNVDTLARSFNGMNENDIYTRGEYSAKIVGFNRMPTNIVNVFYVYTNNESTKDTVFFHDLRKFNELFKQ